MGTIDSMFAMYESRFTDDITVKACLQRGGGLGTNLYGAQWAVKPRLTGRPKG